MSVEREICARLRTAAEGRKRKGIHGSSERAIRIDDVRNALITTGATESVILNAICEAYSIRKASARQYLIDARHALANELVRYSTAEELREMLAHRIGRIDQISDEAQRSGDLKVAATCQVHLYRVTEAAYRAKLGEGEYQAELVSDERMIAASVECIRQNARKLSPEQRQVLRTALGQGHLHAV